MPSMHVYVVVSQDCIVKFSVSILFAALKAMSLFFSRIYFEVAKGGYKIWNSYVIISSPSKDFKTRLFCAIITKIGAC